MTLLKLLLLLPSLAAAHFTIIAPTPIGPFDEDTEATSPCGGVSVDINTDNATDFHVAGEPIALFLGHPTGNWLFRATLDQTASTNWSQIYPIFTQTGEGDYCQPAVAAPSSFVGHKGILGVAMNGPDGLLYQCAVVNFVEGSGTTTSDCKNASSVTAAFSSDSSLTPLISQDQSQTNGTSTAGASSSSSSAASAAAGLVTPMAGLAGSLVAVFAAGLVGAGLMI